MVELRINKAGYPIYAIGISKVLSEKIMVAKSRNLNGTGTAFYVTRYGNVMASKGSVVPLFMFINQIKHNQTLTVTNPKMTGL